MEIIKYTKQNMNDFKMRNKLLDDKKLKWNSIIIKLKGWCEDMKIN